MVYLSHAAARSGLTDRFELYGVRHMSTLLHLVIYKQACMPSFSKIAAWLSALTYPRELDAGEFGEDAAAADGGSEQDFAGHVFRDGADPGGIFSAGEGADRRQNMIGGVGTADDEHPSFTGAVEGIESQHIAGSLYSRINGQGGSVKFDGERRPFREFVQCGGDAASGWIAQHADVRTGCIKCGGADLMERSTVGA